MKTLLVAALLALVSSGAALAQNPQSQVAPPFAVNAKWVNGIAPGYAPLPGTGLHISVGQGSVNCLGTVTNYAGGTLTLTASTTNYVYLDAGASCAPTVKTTAFVNGDIPVATVVTGISGITSISDARTFFYAGVGVAANPASPAYAVQFANSGASAFQGDSTYSFNPTTHILTIGGTDAAPRGCVDLNATLPGGLGAACVGDGATDDTACFLTHVQYANSNPYPATANGISKACVRVSGGSATSPKRYLIKSPTDMCAIIGNPNATCPAYNHGMILVGDGKDVSRLIPDLSSAGPFLDFGSGSYNSAHDFTIEDVTGDATTIGIIFSEGNQTASSDNNRLYHATIRLQNGSNPQNIGALFCRTDLSGPGEDVDIVTQGTALVQGNGGGPASANGFTSPFYPLFNGSGYCTGGDADTHQYIGSNSNYGSLNSQTIALTGSDEYDMGGNVYVTLDGTTTTVPGVMTVGNTGYEFDYLFFNGLRIEDHGTHTSTLPAAIWFMSRISGGHISGALTTGNGGAILGGTSAATLGGLTVNAEVGVTGSTFSLFNLGSYIYASHFLLGETETGAAGITMGTSTGSYDSEIKTGLLTTAQIVAGLANYRQTNVCGSDGCKKTSEDWFPILVSQLPGGAFPGNTWLVGDATTASATGGICVGTGTMGGSGTVYASAFWNGSHWICNQ